LLLKTASLMASRHGKRHAQVYATATAYPPYVMGQKEVEAQAERVFGHNSKYFRRMAAAYGNAGVTHACLWSGMRNRMAGRSGCVYLKTMP
jgi:hypothetical protein